MILNLTQHAATPDQIAAGVVDAANPKRLAELLTIRIGGVGAFAELDPAIQADLLRLRANAIIETFVLPWVVKVTREHFLQLSEEPIKSWDNVRVLNARNMPRIQAMIGGFAPLMATLVPMLKEIGCDPLYALSDRVSVEETQPDGTVRKVNEFRHMGFYPA